MFPGSAENEKPVVADAIQTQCDVAIVGYGPVGATAAALLGGQGLKVVVIERMAGVYDKPRAITADHEVMRVMQFAGIGKELGAHIRPHPGTQYLGVDGQIIKQTNVVPTPFPLGWPVGIHFVQPEYETMLRDAVARHGNVEVRLSHELVDFAEANDRITLEVRDLESGQTSSIDTRYLLACDGANSFVRKRLGIGYEDLAFDEWWVVVDAWERAPTSFPKMNTQYCWPSRPASAITGPRNLRRWELKILPHEKPEEFHDQARVREVLKDFIEIDAIELWRSAVYRFHALVADRWSQGRIFLLGDSAHQTPPFLGQGMCAGIRDASNLIWKLLLVEKAGASPALLRSYQVERKVHVKNVVEQAKDLGLVIGELDLEAAKRRDARLRAERTRAGGDPARHRLIPPLAGGLIDCDEDGTPRAAAGTLFPQPTATTADGRTALMDDVLPPAFLAVSRTTDAQSALSEQATAMLHRIGGARVLLRSPADATQVVPPDVVVLTEQDPLFANWLAESGAAAAVVRPDRYVYGVARTPDDLQPLLDRLSKSLFEKSLFEG
jgi:3-(3-hydroxy-phenyl)propionate hydroxylase